MINGNQVSTDDYYVSGGSAIYTKNILGFRTYSIGEPGVSSHSIVIDIPESTSDQEINVRYRTYGDYVYTNSSGGGSVVTTSEDTVDVEAFLTLSVQETTSNEYIYLSTVANKVLDLINVKDVSDLTVNPYVLDTTTETLIETILCPETTITSYNAWDALLKIAKIDNSIPELGGSDFKTISFKRLDEIPDLDYEDRLFNSESLSYTLDTYVSGLESNAVNVIEEDSFNNGKIEPYEGGWMTVRSKDELVGQITEDSAAFKTRQAIFRIYEMFIKGIKVSITDGTTTKLLYGNQGSYELSNSYWDISDRVLDSEEWNILEETTRNTNDAERLQYRTKGNTIHYTSGSKYIDGLGYQTKQLSDIIGTVNAPRALMELIMVKAAELIDSNVEYDGYYVVKPTTLSGDPEEAIFNDHDIYEGVLARINYMALTDSRATVYKHNVFDSGVNLVTFINEQDALNDTTNLGIHITTTLNKQGNMQYAVSGKTEAYNSIPKLGYLTNNGLVVTGRNLNLSKNIIDYSLDLSEDFITQHSYYSPDSKHRIMEISNSDTVFRQDKYTEYIVLTKDIENVRTTDFSCLSIVGNQKLIQNFGNLGGANTVPLSYAKADIVKDLGGTTDDNEVSFDLPVNGYSIGTTVNLQLNFDTNYSAGPNKFKTTVTGTDVATIQSYTNYTNRFGKFYSIDLNLYSSGISDNSETDANLYPTFNESFSGTPLISLDLIVNKDAREKYGVNFEFPFISDDSSVIRTYPGISKYSGLIRNTDKIDVGMALLNDGYFPSVNQTKLDTSKVLITSTAGTILIEETYGNTYNMNFINIAIPANTRYEGYAVYERITGELIYAVKEDIAPMINSYLYTTDRINFVPRKYLKDNTRPIE